MSDDITNNSTGDSKMFYCCECDTNGKFYDLQDAYDNGWFQYDEANYCPDHAQNAIEICDCEKIIWSDDFGPGEIVGKVIECLDPEINKNEIGVLNRFIDTMGYVAPEIKDARFWGGCMRFNFTSICGEYFNTNKRVHDIFESAVQKYREVGFKYKRKYKKTV